MTEGISAGEAMMLGNGGMGGSWAWIVILLLAFNGGGFGGRGYADSNLARIQDVYASNDLQSIRTAINNLGNGIADATFALNNTIVNGHNTLGRDMFGGFNNVQFAVEGVKDAVKDCCCTTQRNIDAVRYENAINTSAITQAIHQDGEETRKLLVAQTVEALKDRIAQQSIEMQSLRGALSQQAQTSTIIGTVLPTPKPAYVVNSPYVSTYNGCGCLY